MVALPVAAQTDGLRDCTASSNWQLPVRQIRSVDNQPLCTIPPRVCKETSTIFTAKIMSCDVGGGVNYEIIVEHKLLCKI